MYFTVMNDIYKILSFITLLYVDVFKPYSTPGLPPIS